MAWSPSQGMRIGIEVSGGVGPLGATLGSTKTVASAPKGRVYLTADPALAIGTRPYSEATANHSWLLGFGGSVGYAWHDEDDASHSATGLWAAPIRISDECAGVRPALSLAVGFRSIGGVQELFVAPKVSAAYVPCSNEAD